MKKFTTTLVATLSIAFLNGCTMARIYSTSGNTVAMTQTQNKSGESFKIQHRLVFDYTSAVDVQELLRDRFGTGRSFQNVTIKVQQDPVDILINVCTLGLAQSKTFEVSGDKIN